MTASQIIFYLISIFILGTGVLSVTSGKIFRSAIWLLFALIGVAGLYFWMEMEFIAAVQIVIYVGGIVVLIIFSIFLTQQAGEKLPEQKLGRKLFSALAAFCGLALVMLQLLKHGFTVSAAAPLEPTVANIGTQMLGVDEYGYSLPFEVVSMLLLAALVGCIVIALKTKSEKK